MKWALLFVEVFCSLRICGAQSGRSSARLEAEYYVAAYSQHYHVPVALVRAIIKRESDWETCAVSSKGAAGLMQLMPTTAKRFRVQDRCNLNENVSGGVRYLAWLMQQFHNDLRLVVGAYYAGEEVIGRRGLGYHNREVVAYVSAVRNDYLHDDGFQEERNNAASEKRDVR